MIICAMEEKKAEKDYRKCNTFERRGSVLNKVQEKTSLKR